MKKAKKPLKLRKRTLRNLDLDSLGQVQGGGQTSYNCAGTNAPRPTQICW